MIRRPHVLRVVAKNTCNELLFEFSSLVRALPLALRVPCILQRARDYCGFTRCTMAEGGGPESGTASDPDEKPGITQTPVPSTESQKQSIGTLLKTPLRKGDEW